MYIGRIKKMLVLRVEHKRDRLRGSSRYYASTDWNYLPCPQKDGLTSSKLVSHFTKHDWHCATKDIHQFKLWWYIDKLHEMEDSIAVILDVPDKRVFHCGKQVLIDRRKSRIVGKICPEKKVPVWTKGLRHSSTTEKERLFQ
jgi:hypothetical protein